MHLKKYLTPSELSERWEGAVVTGTLANWRSKGCGPRYRKFGSRVRYLIADIEEWEGQQVAGGGGIAVPRTPRAVAA